jgi:hypothetical protein
MSEARNENERDLAWPWAVGVAVFAGLVRLIPHPHNLTPVGALGLFAGARLRSGWAFAVPLAVMAGSDLLLWWISGYAPFNWFVYGSFLLTVLLGRLLLRNAGAGRIALVSVASSLQFFLLTNFGVWLVSSVEPAQIPGGAAVVFASHESFTYPVAVKYARNLEGLAACYAVSMPFWQTNAPPLGLLGNMVAGDLFYCALLFGLYAGLRRGAFTFRRTNPATSLR